LEAVLNEAAASATVGLAESWNKGVPSSGRKRQCCPVTIHPATKIGLTQSGSVRVVGNANCDLESFRTIFENQ
jgi:hypothetical protein